MDLLRPLLVLAALATTADARNQPNIILFLADDVGHGDVGPYDHDNDPATPPVTNTPVLDRLTSEGVRMTQFYANSPVCSPTRAALLTGRHSIRSRITGTFTPVSSNGLPTSEVTIAEILKPLGYRTYMVGKWHLGHLDEFLPNNQGFDEFYGVPYSNDMIPFYLVRNGTPLPDPVDQATLTQSYTTEAKGFISDAVTLGKPFFLYVAYTMPHVPVYVSTPFEGITGRGLYEDAMYEMDWSIGEIEAHVQSLGLAQSTLMIFTSDNGACDPLVSARPNMPEPWRFDACGRNAPFSGYKIEFKEGGLREPFIAHWPGTLPAGTTSNAIASVLDVFPTVATITGAQLPAGVTIDGRDLFDHWTSGPPPPATELFFYRLGQGSAWGRKQMKAMRSRYWKLFFDPTFQPAQLYNLLQSPAEVHEVSFPSLAATMHDKGRSFDCALEETPPAPPMGRNLAAAATISTSSSVDCDTAVRATDGRGWSKWTSTTDGDEWLMLDFGHPTLLSEAVLLWGASYAVQYRIETADDPDLWTEVHAETAGRGGTERFPILKKARYLRITATQSSGEYYELHELVTFGKALRHPGLLAEPVDR